mmetsp:Transcript_57807/g.102659  ORF Transcript_57807/g.102659 Transcript_57807/m.102659 type:complete len:379 (-) Transcript_57807:23-1159(-)
MAAMLQKKELSGYRSGSLLTSVTVLLAAASLSLALLSEGEGSRAWLPSGESHVGSQRQLLASRSRRSLLKESALVGGAALWAAEPEEAMAFRSDRIFNAKATVVPRIRSRYQKLEGLRDDVKLILDLEGERRTIQARPATWFSGLESSLDGPVIMAGIGEQSYGCNPFTVPKGAVVLIARGRCDFAKKMYFANEAGAKSVILYDAKMSKLPFEQQNVSGLIRSKGVTTRAAGDALTGSATSPVERGLTLMSTEKEEGKPEIDAAMINLVNGTSLVEALTKGKTVKVLDVQRNKFEEGIDKFIKKDLPKLSKDMEGYSLVQRIAKDDLFDPRVKLLEKDRIAFEEAVKKKDQAEYKRTFEVWNSDLDPTIGQWDLAETF